ncbi:helix-turn-helix domain-containing protein [Prevotella sp. KH2C16]|uniref:AraC family transcriptional regulator n=1 Tax=Prevotella sp. KH2C16 TaxID=1855325 RepID=UPI0008E3A2CB|nr:helix-turn-helix domain-containing protein [Prevotella sp. KH2C16]SFG04430.1 AraC-type DNA-binding protein [Prevotella sp. KH2C16]
MSNSQFEPITIAKAKKAFQGEYIDDDIILFDQFAKLPFPTESRILDCILVGLCLQGNARYTVDTEIHEVSAGDVLIISHGQVTGNFQRSHDFNGIGLMISFNFFSEMVKDIHEISSVFLFSRSHPVFRLLSDEEEVFKEYYNLIRRKMRDNSHHFRKDVVCSLLTTMLYDIGNSIYRIQQLGDRKQTRSETIFIQFMHLLEENFRHERRVSWYGQQLCITSKYLSESVKQISKRTPNDWIDSYVVREIRVQLKSSTKSIKEISQEMNFPNQSFFGKYFREHTGLSPSEYRRS